MTYRPRANFPAILLLLLLFNPTQALGADGRFPLTVFGNAGADGERMHFSGSVPFAPGELLDVAAIRVLKGDREVPADVIKLSGWRDGAVRSALVQFDFQQNGVEQDFTLEYGKGVRRQVWPSDLKTQIDPTQGGLLANARVAIRFGPRGVERIDCDLDGDGERETHLGKTRMVATISGRGHYDGQQLDGPVEVPAKYEVLEQTPRYTTVRVRQRWGGLDGERWPLEFVTDYTLWAGDDVIHIKAYFWPTSAGCLGPGFRARGRDGIRPVTSKFWDVQRLAWELVRPQKVSPLEVGTETPTPVDLKDGPVFFTRTPHPTFRPPQSSGLPVRSHWRLDQGEKTIAQGKGNTGQYLLAKADDCLVRMLMKDLDAWGAWSTPDKIDPSYLLERTCWNAHLAASDHSLVAGILDVRNQKDWGKFEAWGGQRWMWHAALSAEPASSQTSGNVFAAAQAALPAYYVPYERWVRAEYLPERKTLSPGLLDWIAILAPDADLQRFPGGPDVSYFGHRAWYEPLLYNWMRHGDPHYLRTFFRLTQQNNQYETSFDPHGAETPDKIPRGASMDGMTFTRGWGPTGSSFYTNPTPALLSYLMSGDADSLAAHERQLWRTLLLSTPDGFMHDHYTGDPQGRKHKSQGRAGSVCQYLINADQLRQEHYANDRSMFDRGVKMYRYFTDFGFEQDPNTSALTYVAALLGGSTHETSFEHDYKLWRHPDGKNPLGEPVACYHIAWVNFHWFHPHSEYFALTGDEEVLHFLPRFAAIWADPRITLRYSQEERAFDGFQTWYDGQCVTGGSLQALSAAQFTDDAPSLTIGKRMLATGLSPTHLWRYDENPDLHPNKQRWYGQILGGNIMPGSAKWGEEFRRTLISGNANHAQRFGQALSIAAAMQNPFVYAHDLERYWYLDQGGKYAVVDDHSQPFDPTYFDRDNKFPDDRKINPATENILAVKDEGSRQTTLQLAVDAGSTHTYRYWSPAQPEAQITDGKITAHTYDPDTQLGILTIQHGKTGAGELTLRYARDRQPPTIAGAWFRNGREPYFHTDLGDYRRVLTEVVYPHVDYEALNAPHARVLTGERTTAVLHYTQTPDQPESWQQLRDDVCKFSHRFELAQLEPGTWYFRIEAADDSGNKTTDDNAGKFHVLKRTTKPSARANAGSH